MPYLLIAAAATLAAAFAAVAGVVVWIECDQRRADKQHEKRITVATEHLTLAYSRGTANTATPTLGARPGHMVGPRVERQARPDRERQLAA